MSSDTQRPTFPPMYIQRPEPVYSPQMPLYQPNPFPIYAQHAPYTLPQHAPYHLPQHAPYTRPQQPFPYVQSSDRPPVLVMDGANPIRGMYTSVQPDVCSSYGSSYVHANGADIYGGSRWCQVGVIINDIYRTNNIMALEAQFKGQQWAFRVRDMVTGLFLYIDHYGKGPYGSFQTNDTLSVPGREGVWRVQIQNQEQYLLYLPL
jgi:hypothetical protein